MSSDSLYRCRVCALHQESPPWGYDGHTPSYLICPCCGTEFGVDDCRFTEIIERRENWIANGAGWFQPALRPESWTSKNQLRDLDKEWTLQSLDLDNEETPTEEFQLHDSDGSNWKPEFIDYFHYVSSATLPTAQQTENFANYVTQLQNWQSSLFPPGHKFVFFLRPYAGYNFQGQQRPLEPIEVTEDTATGDNQVPTHEYQQRFGAWDYYIDTDWTLNTVIHGLQHGTSLPQAYVRQCTCRLTGFLGAQAAIDNRDLLHQHCSVFVHSQQQEIPRWKRLLLPWIQRSSEYSRYRILAKAIEPYRRSKEKSIKLDPKWVAREAEIQGARFRDHLEQVLSVYHQHRALTVEEFWSDRERIIQDIAANEMIYFVNNGSVLGPEDPLGRVMGLIDEEYGWPMAFELNDLPEPKEWMNRRRCHPFIMHEGRCLAVCIQLSEYKILVEKTS